MTFERRPALLPMLAILFLVLAGCSSGGMSPGMPNVHSQPVEIHTGNVTCQPDFTLSLSPSSATITSGQNVRISVELASLCGLAGSINVGIHKISPQPNGNGFTINQPRYDIPLDANGTAVAYITLGATPNTLKTTYTITIQGKNIQGGCCYGITHSAIFTLTVK
jgi:hypothetical protein